MASATECGELRWVTPKEAAQAAEVAAAVVWAWCRAGSVKARRLPGRRGRWRVALVEGLPVTVQLAPRRRQ